MLLHVRYFVRINQLVRAASYVKANGIWLWVGSSDSVTPKYRGGSPPPPFWGTLKHHKEGKKRRACARKRRILVLNSYPDPPPPPRFRNLYLPFK